MKLVTCNLGVYRLSDRNYKRMLVNIANEDDSEIENLGTWVGVVETDISDLDAHSAKIMLEVMKESKK